jgi:hypothetical protein
LTSPSQRPRGQPSALVAALATNSEQIAGLCEDFTQLAPQYAIISFYETKSWPNTSTPIVDQMSARLYLPHEEPVPLDVIHTDLCRFSGDDDSSFTLTCARIQRAARGVAVPMTPAPVAAPSLVPLPKVTAEQNRFMPRVGSGDHRQLSTLNQYNFLIGSAKK